MKLGRLWNFYVSKSLKRKSSSVLIILVIVMMYMCWAIYTKNTFLNLCPSEANSLRAVDYKDSGINIIPSSPSKSQGNPDISQECVSVQTPDDAHFLITCIHDPSKDLMLSAHLKHKGGWERDNVKAMYKAQSLYPGMMLVDLGCNIGVFTLPAAKLGMEVLAVDAMTSSLRLLQRSLLFNDLTCPVTLIHNALHNSRKQVRLSIDPTNIGGSQVLEIDDEYNGTSSSEIINAICLDDLASFVHGKDVFLKMDLEGTEVHVLQCAHLFFSQVDIKVILIEWMFYRINERASDRVKSFLTSHGFLPTWGVDPNRIIDLEASHSWPDNVFWMKLNRPIV